MLKPKSRMKLLEEVEKARKTLITHDTVTLTVEALDDNDEHDLIEDVERDQFLECIESITEKLRSFLGKVINEYHSSQQGNQNYSLQRSSENPFKIDVVELLGEVTRIGKFQEVIKSVLQVDELNRTMHS